MFTVFNNRVHAYLSENSQGKTLDKATGKVERPDSLFVIGRGKGPMSGIQRQSDLPALDPENGAFSASDNEQAIGAFHLTSGLVQVLPWLFSER